MRFYDALVRRGRRLGLSPSHVVATEMADRANFSFPAETGIVTGEIQADCNSDRASGDVLPIPVIVMRSDGAYLPAVLRGSEVTICEGVDWIGRRHFGEGM